MLKMIICVKCKEPYSRLRIIRGACNKCYSSLRYRNKIGILSDDALNSILKPSNPAYLKAEKTKKRNRKELENYELP